MEKRQSKVVPTTIEVQPAKMEEETDAGEKTTNTNCKNIWMNKSVVIAFVVAFGISVSVVVAIAAVGFILGIWNIGQLQDQTCCQHTIAIINETLMSEVNRLSAEMEHLTSEATINSNFAPNNSSALSYLYTNLTNQIREQRDELADRSDLERLESGVMSYQMWVNNTLNSLSQQFDQLHRQVDENSNRIGRVNSTMLQLIHGLELTFRHDVEELAIATHTNHSQLRNDTERNYLQLTNTLERQREEISNLTASNYSLSNKIVQLDLAISRNFTSVRAELHSIARELRGQVDEQSTRHGQDIADVQQESRAEDASLRQYINSKHARDSASVAKQLIATTLLFPMVTVSIVYIILS